VSGGLDYINNTILASPDVDTTDPDELGPPLRWVPDDAMTNRQPEAVGGTFDQYLREHQAQCGYPVGARKMAAIVGHHAREGRGGSETWDIITDMVWKSLDFNAYMGEFWVEIAALIDIGLNNSRRGNVVNGLKGPLQRRGQKAEKKPGRRLPDRLAGQVNTAIERAQAWARGGYTFDGIPRVLTRREVVQELRMRVNETRACMGATSCLTGKWLTFQKRDFKWFDPTNNQATGQNLKRVSRETWNASLNEVSEHIRKLSQVYAR